MEQSTCQQRVPGSIVSASYTQRYNRLRERVHTRRADIQELTSSKKHVNRCVKWKIKLSSHNENLNECTIFLYKRNQSNFMKIHYSDFQLFYVYGQLERAICTEAFLIFERA